MGANKVLIEGSSVTASQLKEFFGQIEDGVWNSANFQLVLNHKLDLPNINIDWARAYKILSMKAEYDVEIAKLGIKQSSTSWVMPVINGVTCNKIVAALRELGVDVYTYYDDLNKNTPTNDRNPKNGSYRVSFRKAVEADPAMKNKSADTLKAESVRGITLLERLLLELGYFLAAGSHLDIGNITLCSGSRSSVGGVPGMYWHADYRRVCVSWYYADSALGNLRTRVAESD